MIDVIVILFNYKMNNNKRLKYQTKSLTLIVLGQDKYLKFQYKIKKEIFFGQ